MRFTAEQQRAVVEAIGRAEKGTSAEIFAVLAHASDDYRFVAGFRLLLWVLAASLLAAAYAWWRWIDIPLPVFTAAQFGAAILAIAIGWFVPGLSVRLTPRAIRYRRAHANAARQFMAHGISRTRGHTGVLVFVSLAERYAEIIADSAISARLGQAFWDDVVAGLIDHARRDDLAAGYVGAIERIGEMLAGEFPPEPGDSNELEDRFVIL